MAAVALSAGAPAQLAKFQQSFALQMQYHGGYRD
jgi:hypothetical protein